jgi:hypothetical protein
MSSSPATAAALRDRFLEEQEYIQKYVGFLQYKTAIFESEIRKLIDALSKYDLAKIERKRDWSLWRKPYSYDELQEVYSSVEAIKPRILEALEATQRSLESTEKPSKLNSIDARSAQGECIQFMLEALEGDPSPEDIERARRDLIEQIESHATEMSGQDEEPVYTEDMVDYAVVGAIYLLRSEKLGILQEALDQIDELGITLRMSSPKAEINVLRQAFILLMTVFDATIFDIARIALRKDFFRLISIFGKQDKISYKDLSKYGSFEGFRDEIIEDQLRGKYLKDILFIFEHLGVQCVDVNTGDRFIQLIEMVLRRNIHIHNRGRVDEKYLERDERGIPKYNIYNLALDSVAYVDAAYWELANRLCKNSVILASAWADSLP